MNITNSTTVSIGLLITALGAAFAFGVAFNRLGSVEEDAVQIKTEVKEDRQNTQASLKTQNDISNDLKTLNKNHDVRLRMLERQAYGEAVAD